MRRCLIIGGLLSALSLGGCAALNDNDGAADAPITSTDDSGWKIINGVDRYPNIAFKCNGKVGMYAPRNADSTSARFIQVLPNDPNCEAK